MGRRLKKTTELIKTQAARLCFGRRPLDDHWAFSSVDNEAFNYNSRYLFLYVREHCPDVHPVYIVNDELLRAKLSGEYGAEYFAETKTFAGIRKILACRVWFTSTAPPLYGAGWRKRHIVVNLWHGVPLKRIGMLQRNLPLPVRILYRRLYADNYAAVLTTSRRMIPVMSRSFCVDPARVKAWGQPRNDMLFDPQAARERLCGLFEEAGRDGEDGGIRWILYAPTFRDRGETRLFPFPEMEGDPGRRAGELAKINAWLARRNLYLCIRMHLYDTDKDAGIAGMDLPGSHIRLLNEDRVGDVMDVLGGFDLLVTDYSSIYIDYLLTERPIIFLPYDREEYLAGRGMNFPYDRVTPGPKPKTLREFLNSIEELLYNTDSYVAGRRKIRKFFHEVSSPCCETICREVRGLIGDGENGRGQDEKMHKEMRGNRR